MAPTVTLYRDLYAEIQYIAETDTSQIHVKYTWIMLITAEQIKMFRKYLQLTKVKKQEKFGWFSYIYVRLLDIYNWIHKFYKLLNLKSLINF